MLSLIGTTADGKLCPMPMLVLWLAQLPVRSHLRISETETVKYSRARSSGLLSFSASVAGWGHPALHSECETPQDSANADEPGGNHISPANVQHFRIICTITHRCIPGIRVPGLSGNRWSDGRGFVAPATGANAMPRRPAESRSGQGA